MAFRFVLNGIPVEVRAVDPNMTLLEFLRGRGFTGTKESCGEGECGACTVVFTRPSMDGSRYEAVHACLVLIGEVLDCEVRTVEGVAGAHHLHPVQRALIEHGASQCGYCTPGFVMSLFAEYYREGRQATNMEAISGNLCRCTGYRSIRKAARSLPMVEDQDAFAARLKKPAPPPTATWFATGERKFFRPTTLAGLWDAWTSAAHAKLMAGGTDVVVEINQVQRRFDALISLGAIPELHALCESQERISIGAAVTLSRLERELPSGIVALETLWPLFGSVLVRNRATLGGNLATASPIGDGNVALLALDAELEIFSESGTRTVPLAEFFVGYRKTALKPQEIIGRIHLPQPLPNFTRFYKVSKRVADDISSVAAAFSLVVADGRIARARVAYGGIAETPRRLPLVEAALTEGPRDQETLERAVVALRASIKPIDDVRASAAYRTRVAEALLRRAYHDPELDKTQESGGLS